MSVLKLRRARFLQLVVISALSLASSAYAQVERFVAGEHYTVLGDRTEFRPLQSTTSAPLITEVFWYGCPHCYEFDPMLDAWVAKQGDSIGFARAPAIWNAMTEHHAKVFYAEQALGVFDQLHKPIFDTIHQKHDFLTDEDDIAALFAEHGVPEDKFNAAFNSFSMDSTLRKNTAMMTALQLPGVPSMVVNGKYLVGYGTAAVPTQQKMLEVVDFLLQKR